jgi:tRNA pseudouridine38-40 synthase
VRTFKLVLAYDGSDFHGWQIQPGQRTVQGTVEDAIEAVLDTRVRVNAAGRTDAGCHARGQVASFRAESTLPAAALRPVLNARLPEDVRVSESTEVDEGFDARRSATARRYSYRLLDRDDVLLRRIAWYPGVSIELDRLARAMQPLEGDHDCAAFQATGSSKTVTRCCIHRAQWRRWDSGSMLDVVANHFLYHMVRNLVGTALAIADRSDPAAAMVAILASRDRRRAGPTAPPQGLCLEQVFYPEVVRA